MNKFQSITSKLTLLRRLLNSSREESIHDFLNKNHELLLFGLNTSGIVKSKFKLGSTFIPDFLIYQPGGSARIDTITIVELKDPTTIPFLKDGKFGLKLNQAINQIDEYKLWINTNKTFFIKEIEKEFETKINSNLFLRDNNANHRSSFILKSIIVIGRKNSFTEKDNERRIQLNQDSNNQFEITHFDRFVEILLNKEVIALSESKFDLTLMREILLTKNKSAITKLASREDIPSSFLMEIASENIAEEELSKNCNCNSLILDKICLKQPLNTIRHRECNKALIEKVFTHHFKSNSKGTFSSYLTTTLITIAMHPLSPTDILNSISEFEDFNYRLNLVFNPNISNDLLNKLSQDPNGSVREYALKKNNERKEKYEN